MFVTLISLILRQIRIIMDNSSYTGLDFGPVEDTSKQIIKVVGVGGGGCNAVKNMAEEGIANVSFAVCNTDSQSLSHSPIPVKVLLGDSGLGAGADPELGRQEALKTKEQVKRLFDDSTKMCFVTAGMGGGTGTGAAPIIASVARSMGILTIGIVTIPFFFEKKNKIIKALKGVEEMRKNVDSLLIINNESICDVYSDSELALKQAFKAADQILCNAVKSISELITLEGNINLDFRDVEATMRNGGGAIMAIGRAKGERRVEKAIINALESPLLYGSDITKAKNILFNIYTSDDAPLFVSEMREIDSFMYGLNPDINVIWGTSDDNTLGKDAKVIILATGLDNKFMPDEPTDEEKQDRKYYDTIISKLYREPLAGLRIMSEKPEPKEVPTEAPAEVPAETPAEESAEEPAETPTAEPTEAPSNVPASDENVGKTAVQKESEEAERFAFTTDFASQTSPTVTIENHSQVEPYAAEPVEKKKGNSTPSGSSNGGSSHKTFLERLKERLAKNLNQLAMDDDDD